MDEGDGKMLSEGQILLRDAKFYEEDDFYVWDFEKNLQYVKPYWFYRKTHTKKRWENKSIEEVFASELSHIPQRIFLKACQESLNYVRKQQNIIVLQLRQYCDVVYV
ncbi:hypothetical protein RFI_24271 [Reticulomyxa filosa]|uniref:Uncharacterized protein n=1 Tax=Reticulomyxa filosa TaxID=46433 RepID=X6MGT5_RETFI|nr:hypothetical protein RFI_24271 [Reticulomyxa filosa]|eukprot:ETO13104.1 hypothetical protein RFI_24271 [Reticulomyxa filosa]